LNQVYITRISKFLPNAPVSSEEIEDILGMVGNAPSKSKRLVLRSNGINTRYYALDKAGNITHTNAEMTALAIRGLEDEAFHVKDAEVLCCGTSNADQLMPSHAAMVHGLLGEKPMETVATSGICCSGMHAMKYGYLSVLAGNSSNAVCTGSELSSPALRARYFENELISSEELKAAPILAFEKDFLRWMLSDGAGAILLENKPRKEISLKIEWIESISYANEQEACMYAGAEKLENKELKGWMQYSPEEWLSRSVFSVKQDVKLLEKNVVKYGAQKLAEICKKRNIKATDFDYFLPHLSSYFFASKIEAEMLNRGLHIPAEKWFTNLSEVGNIGAASIYLILENLFNSGRLKRGEKLLVMVPESGRFSYVFSYLTVV